MACWPQCRLNCALSLFRTCSESYCLNRLVKLHVWLLNRYLDVPGAPPVRGGFPIIDVPFHLLGQRPHIKKQGLAALSITHSPHYLRSNATKNVCSPRDTNSISGSPVRIPRSAESNCSTLAIGWRLTSRITSPARRFPS